MGIIGMQQRLAVVLAPDLELGQRMMLVAFDEQQIAGRNTPDLVFQGRLRLAAQLVHDDPAPVGHDHDLAAAGLAVAVRILARLVDVEAVMRVLDHRNPEAPLDEARNELLDQRGLAASRPSRESEYFHPDPSRRIAPAKSVIVSGRHSHADIANGTAHFAFGKNSCSPPILYPAIVFCPSGETTQSTNAWPKAFLTFGCFSGFTSMIPYWLNKRRSPSTAMTRFPRFLNEIQVPRSARM